MGLSNFDPNAVFEDRSTGLKSHASIDGIQIWYLWQRKFKKEAILSWQVNFLKVTDGNCLRTLRVSLGEVEKRGKLTYCSVLSLPFFTFPLLSNRSWVFSDGWEFITLFADLEEESFPLDCYFNCHCELVNKTRFGRAISLDMILVKRTALCWNENVKESGHEKRKCIHECVFCIWQFLKRDVNCLNLIYFLEVFILFSFLLIHISINESPFMKLWKVFLMRSRLI